MKRVELLAPAKDLYTAKVAIEAGANAVYLGGKNFGARFFATNLENEDLKEAVLFAHTRGSKGLCYGKYYSVSIRMESTD